MKIKNLKINRLKLIKTKIHHDKRGFFKEIYKDKILKKNLFLMSCLIQKKMF